MSGFESCPGQGQMRLAFGEVDCRCFCLLTSMTNPVPGMKAGGGRHRVFEGTGFFMASLCGFRQNFGPTSTHLDEHHGPHSLF